MHVSATAKKRVSTQEHFDSFHMIRAATSSPLFFLGIVKRVKHAQASENFLPRVASPRVRQYSRTLVFFSRLLSLRKIWDSAWSIYSSD